MDLGLRPSNKDICSTVRTLYSAIAIKISRSLEFILIDIIFLADKGLIATFIAEENQGSFIWN
jgi:hypothetical protein